MPAIELRRRLTWPKSWPKIWNVLDDWKSPSWNDQTRAVVAERLEHVPERRFFNAAEWAILQAAVDRLLPQPDRPEPIPVAAFIDDKLARDIGDGYRYAGMPHQRDAWRLGLAAIEAEAQARFHRGFAELEPGFRDMLLKAIQHGEALAEWPLPPRRFFMDLLLKTAVTFYYAHPDAWTEIGFGGPASPRGYVRLGLDRRDGWEPPRMPWPPR